MYLLFRAEYDSNSFWKMNTANKTQSTKTIYRKTHSFYHKRYKNNITTLVLPHHIEFFIKFFCYQKLILYPTRNYDSIHNLFEKIFENIYIDSQLYL